jgi:hypothetical protein
MRSPVCALVLAGALAAASCGEDEEHANRERPASTIDVTAAILDDGVHVSPRKVGAGPIRLLVSNQTGDAQELTFATGGGDAGVTRTTPPIAASGTATLQVDVTEGSYEVSAGDLRAATVQVGAARPSAQNELLLP